MIFMPGRTANCHYYWRTGQHNISRLLGLLTSSIGVYQLADCAFVIMFVSSSKDASC